MNTSSADVPDLAAKRYFFLLWTSLATRLASRIEIEPPFDAGLSTKRPVAALRPATWPPGLPVLGDAELVEVAMPRKCVLIAQSARDKSRTPQNSSHSPGRELGATFSAFAPCT